MREPLHLADGAPAIYVERLRLADGIPFILERRHIAARFCPGLTRRQAEGSIYALFTRRHGLSVSSATQSIRAVNLSATDAARLEVPAGAAALRVHAVGATPRGPLWVEDTLYRGDLYEFLNEVNAAGRHRPASLAICARPMRHPRPLRTRETP